MITFKEFLIEATHLARPEWAKDKKSSGGPFQGETRISILKKLINKDTADDYKLTLKDTDEEITLDFDDPHLKHLDSLLKPNMTSEDDDKLDAFLKSKPIKDKNTGKSYALKDIKKSEIFGGGTAKSGGTAGTKKSESLQCIVCALTVLNGEEIDKDFITVDNIKTVSDQFNVDYNRTHEEYADEIVNDKKWYTTYIKTASKIFNEFNLTDKHVFNRKSKWVKDLEKEALRSFSELEDNIFSTKIDKWNPADIWITKGDINIKRFDTLVELNCWLLEKFNEDEVIGVSLKQNANPKLEVKNDDKEKDVLHLDDIEYFFANADNEKAIFNRKYIAISFSDDKGKHENEIYVRTNKGELMNVIAELMGKLARHGSAGFGNIQTFLRKANLQELETTNDIMKLIDDNETDPEKKYKRLLDKLIDYIVEFSKLSPSQIEKAFYNSDKLTVPFAIARYQSAQLIYILKTADEETQKEFVENITVFMSSTSILSSVFVKVH